MKKTSSKNLVEVQKCEKCKKEPFEVTVYWERNIHKICWKCFDKFEKSEKYLGEKK